MISSCLSLLVAASALTAPAGASEGPALSQARAALAGPTASFDGVQEYASVAVQPGRGGVAVAPAAAESQAGIYSRLSNGLSASVPDVPNGEDKPDPQKRPAPKWLTSHALQSYGQGALLGAGYGAIFGAGSGIGAVIGALIGAAVGCVLAILTYNFVPA